MRRAAAHLLERDDDALGVSVAVSVDPDMLIIDEVLGGGDHPFFAKCLERIMQFRGPGEDDPLRLALVRDAEKLCSRVGSWRSRYWWGHCGSIEGSRRPV